MKPKHMGINDFIDIAQSIAGTAPDVKPAGDHTEQVNLGMDFAKRQAERQPVEAPKIPSMGATPLAN